MFETYIRSILRSLRRDKFHAALNVLGLSIALAASLLIALYVQNELSYDNFFTQPDRVFRIEMHGVTKGRPPIDTGGTPYNLIDALKSDLSDRLIPTRISGTEYEISVGTKTFREVINFADPTLFDVLDFPMAQGDAATAITRPGDIILTEHLALKLFGTETAIGKTMQVKSAGKIYDVHVAAIMKDVPETSSLSYIEAFMPMASLIFVKAPWMRVWSFTGATTFVRLKGTTTETDIDRELPGLVARHLPAQQKAIADISLSLRPIRDVHLYAGDEGFINDRNAVAVFALAGTAAFLILIACFNYINLATARALLRTKEVGMRKIMGASRRQLLLQFLGETAAMTFAAFVLALVMAAIALPVFATLLDRDLSLAAMATPEFFATAAGLLAFVSLAAGFYPALVLSNFRPIQLFQNQKASTGGRATFRNVMVGLQFSLTVGMIVVAVVAFTQVRFLETMDLGFNKQGVLIVHNLPAGKDASRATAYRDALVQSPYFSAVAASNAAPTPYYEGTYILSRSGTDDYQLLSVIDILVDPGFFRVYGVKPIAGRVFSEKRSDEMVGPGESDPNTYAPIVISRSTVAFFGFASPEAAIGQHLISPRGKSRYDFTVVGVVPDIHFRLGREPIKPTFYLYRTDALGTASARVVPGRYREAVAFARKTWSAMFAGAMDYEFLEDAVAAANADDSRQSELFTFFTGLAIAVACLGLFGLASFVATRRTREIAIRKVMGASTTRITRLLVWDFAKPILLANLVAWPIAWVLMRQWLNGFAYRVDLSVWFFLGAAGIALLIALATVIGQTLRAARTRPAEALAYE